MFFQFLVEDKSSEILINILINKFKRIDSSIEYRCKYFKGIGGFTKKNTVKETKTGKLLNDLATYLRGFNKSLQHISATVFVILDNDTREVESFRNSLEEVAVMNEITIDYVFCVAIEEMESWLLGDDSAIKMAYPSAKLSLLQSYNQDSICGAWEKLADVVYSGGSSKMKKEKKNYMEIGICKSEWAKNIGEYMSLDNNKSPSFNSFINEVYNRISIT